MTGLIVLELMMIRQTEKVEGGQDVQYIDSWGEAGWRRRSVLGSWTVKLLPFQTPSVRLIPRVVSKIPSMIGPNCQGKGRTRWRTKLRCRTMLLRGQSTRLSCLHVHHGLGRIPVDEQLSPGVAIADHSLAFCLAC